MNDSEATFGHDGGTAPKEEVSRKVEKIRAWKNMFLPDQVYIKRILAKDYEGKLDDVPQNTLQKRAEAEIKGGLMPIVVSDFLQSFYGVTIVDNGINPVDPRERKKQSENIKLPFGSLFLINLNLIGGKLVGYSRETLEGVGDEAFRGVVSERILIEKQARLLSEAMDDIVESFVAPASPSNLLAIKIIEALIRLNLRDNNLSCRVIEIVANNMDKVKEMIFTGEFDTKKHNSAIQLLDAFIEKGSEEQAKRGLRSACDYFTNIFFKQENEARKKNYGKFVSSGMLFPAEAVDNLFLRCARHADESDFADLLTVAKKHPDLVHDIGIAAMLCDGEKERRSEDQTENAHNKYESRAMEFMQIAGLPAETIYKFSKDWYRSDGENTEETIKKNIDAYRRLEAKAPGITGTLSKENEFGLTDFYRYPEALLLEQYEDKDKDDLPYGLVIFPKDDHNGVFYNQGFINGLFWQLKDLKDENGNPQPCRMRVVEVDRKFSIGRSLANLAKRYPAHKISFAIVGGHGESDMVTLGKDQYDKSGKNVGLLKSDDLQGNGVKQMGKFFEKGATIIMDSCSTGDVGGIGQEISRVFGVRVLASATPFDTLLAKVSMDKNYTLHFDATFIDKDNPYTSGENKRVYENGLLQHN